MNDEKSRKALFFIHEKQRSIMSFKMIKFHKRKSGDIIDKRDL